jgi:hypothetical protein
MVVCTVPEERVGGLVDEVAGVVPWAVVVGEAGSGGSRAGLSPVLPFLIIVSLFGYFVVWEVTPISSLELLSLESRQALRSEVESCHDHMDGDGLGVTSWCGIV